MILKEYNCYLSRLRVQFSYLREHKFRRKFQYSCPMCLCQTGIENNEHFLLHCPRHSNYHKNPDGCISSIVDIDLGNFSSTDICNLLLYGNSHLSFDTNGHIIKSTITLIESTVLEIVMGNILWTLGEMFFSGGEILDCLYQTFKELQKKTIYLTLCLVSL